jgi:hypothetical protein
MFEEAVGKDNRAICISEEQSEQAEILAGKYGHQAKILLEWWIAHSISTAIDEAKQYAEQDSSIEEIRFGRFDSHYRKMRNLFVSHLQLLNPMGPDNFYLFGLYPRDADLSEILRRMADLQISYERSFQSESQTVNGMNTAEPIEDTEGTVKWRRVQVLVKVLEHAGKPLNKLGMITVVHTEDDCTVKLLHNFQQISVAGTNMTRVEIHKDDNIIVVSGPHEGKMGQLYDILDGDGIVKLLWFPDGQAIPDNLESLQILDIWRLCLYGSIRDERQNPTKAESEYFASVDPAKLDLHLDFSHDIAGNDSLDIRFTAEYMNKYPMEIFEKSGYVYDSSNIYTTSNYMKKWSSTTARWPMDAVPAYKIIVGTYTFGPFRNHEHVMYTLDESGYIRVPHDTEMGNKSWLFWHALYDSGTRDWDGKLENDELDALRHHIYERNTRIQMRSQLRNQHDEMRIDESSTDNQRNIASSQMPSFDFSSTFDHPSLTTMEPSIVSNQIPVESQRDNVSNQTPSAQFFVRMKNQSKPRNIALSASMDSLVEIVTQVTGVPREYLRINIGKHVWANSNPGSSSIMDFGFVAKCTLEISVLGKAGSKSGSQTKKGISSSGSEPEFDSEPEFPDVDLNTPVDLETPVESDDDSDSDDSDYSGSGDDSSSETGEFTNDDSDTASVKGFETDDKFRRPKY